MAGTSPHVIRLRGPWHYVPLARTVLKADGVSVEESGALPPSGRCHMPSDWASTLGRDFRGRVLYERSFGCPSGLAAEDRVLLIVEQVDAWARVTLNQTPLGQIPAGALNVAFDVTARLKQRNRLGIEVELPRRSGNSPTVPRPDREGLAGGLVGEVRLEIHAAESG